MWPADGYAAILVGDAATVYIPPFQTIKVFFSRCEAWNFGEYSVQYIIIIGKVYILVLCDDR